MFYSLLTVDDSMNRRKMQPGYDWARNAYRIKQRICKAIDDAAQCEDQEGRTLFHFFPKGLPEIAHRFFDLQVATFPRQDGFGAHAQILVSTPKEPDWGRAFDDAPYLVFDAERTPITSLDQINLPEDGRLEFVIKANPVTSKSKRSGGDGHKYHIADRLDVLNGQPSSRESALAAWLKRKLPTADIKRLTILEDQVEHVSKGKNIGSTVAKELSIEKHSRLKELILANATSIPKDWQAVKDDLEWHTRQFRNKNDTSAPSRTITIKTTTFLGRLEGLDSTALMPLLANGIGASKSLGCGMLVLGLPNS